MSFCQMNIVLRGAEPYVLDVESGTYFQPMRALPGEKVLGEWELISYFSINRNGSICTFETGKSAIDSSKIYRRVQLRGPTWCRWHQEELARLKEKEGAEFWNNTPMSRREKDRLADLRLFRDTYRKKSYE